MDDALFTHCEQITRLAQYPEYKALLAGLDSRARALNTLMIEQPEPEERELARIKLIEVKSIIRSLEIWQERYKHELARRQGVAERVKAGELPPPPENARVDEIYD